MKNNLAQGALALSAIGLLIQIALLVSGVTSGYANAISTAAISSVFYWASLLGVILGHVSLSQIKRRGEEGRKLAIASLWIGYGTLLVMPFLGLSGFLSMSRNGCIGPC